MGAKAKMNMAYSMSTKGGAVISISESSEPDKAILSIGEGDKATSISLTKEEFELIMDLQYKVVFVKPEVAA